MQSGEASKSSLFLIEMVIALLFFSICSAICIRVFAAALEDTAYSRNLSSATSLCQSASEVYKASSGNIERTAEIINGGYNMGCARVYYDRDWNETKDEYNAEFMLIVEDKGMAGNVKSAHIYAEKCSGGGTGECIFSLNVKTLEDVD